MGLHVASHTYVQHHSSSMPVLLSGRRPCSCSTTAPAAQFVQKMKVHSSQQREVGCSDLYNMAEEIKAQSQVDQSRRSTALPASSDAAPPYHPPPGPGKNVKEPPPPAASTNRGVGYYAGLVTTSLEVDNKASGADMLKRSLQLAGGVAGLLALLTYIFLASNNLV
ncbi:hypothetical protein COO60DRAFT_1623389 [Scenedesmus sp. NREL 46B-D3]|nr:hypothetical protein COO60DRAFT_1623389 [Scenedesmus sp. NREL 46B-D3]